MGRFDAESLFSQESAGRFDFESLFSQESAGDQTGSASMASGCTASDQAGSASMASGRIEGHVVRVFVIRHD